MSNNNDITALREHLFATLRGVKDGSIDIDRAKTVNEIGKTLVDTARVEVDFLRATGGTESIFLSAPLEEIATLPTGITGVTRHLIRK